MEAHVRESARDLSVAAGPEAADAPLTVRGALARRAFRIALLVLPLGVVGNLLYTLLATDRALLASLRTLPSGYLLFALALGLVPWITGTLRLLVWTRFLRCRIPLRELLRMTLVIDLGNAVSPTAIGGEAFRWGMLVRNGVRPATSATLALLPKVEDALFFAIALPTAILWTRSWELPVVASSVRLVSDNAQTVLGVGAIIVLAVWIAMRFMLFGHAGERVQRWIVRRWGRVRRRMRRFTREAGAVAVEILLRSKGRFALTLSLTAVHWMARYSVVAALAAFLGVSFDPVLFWLLQWVVFSAMTFVPTPGAAGGAEIAFTAVYATLLPSGTIGLATAAWRFFTFYAPVGLAALLFPLLAVREAPAPARAHA